MAITKPVVFISCGQYSDAEKKLGKEICQLIGHLRPDLDPYFAENQSTLDGLSDHVLKALHRAAAFICVMHPRGDIQRPDRSALTRGSVWVEQEIAIAAFVNRVLGRSIPIYFYKHKSVGREGVRDVLLLNPREFTDEQEVLEDLRMQLPGAKVNPFMAYEIIYHVKYKAIEVTQSRHIYELQIDIENVGKSRVEDFALRVTFPQAFLMDVSVPTPDSHKVLCFNAKDWAKDGLYPGDKLKRPIAVRYFVDGKLNDSAQMASEFTVDLLSGDMEPKLSTHKIREFNEF